MLKIEDVNYAIGSKKLAPLYCLAISSKRYVLFNLDEQTRPIIRKASAHGLGHLIAPYGSEEAPPNIPAPAVPLSETGVDRWQYDLWFQIVRAVLDGHPEQVDLTSHPALQLPAMSRYAVTTPALERWFKKHNARRSYQHQVKPFNFMCGFQASPLAGTSEETFMLGNGSKSPRMTKQRPLRPIAPYSQTSKEGSTYTFDRETAGIGFPDQLKTYAQVLAQYHLRPEAKFDGPTRRRHVQATQINYIGKEANRWEEQFFLGMDEDAVIEYGTDPNMVALFDELMVAVGQFGKPQLASHIGISRNSLAKILDLKCQNLSPRISRNIRSAIMALNSRSLDEENQNSKLLQLVRVEIAEFARRLQIDASNLGKVMDGTRK